MAKRLSISVVVLLALIAMAVWRRLPTTEQIVPFLVWSSGSLMGVVTSRGRGFRCILFAGIGGAAGALLLLFYITQIPPPREQWFPLLLLTGIGMVAGICLGTWARWCVEGVSRTKLVTAEQSLGPPQHAFRPRWYQFSLRRLLLMFALTSIMFGSVGLRSWQIREESLAASELRKVGGVFGYRRNWVTHCYLCGPKIQDVELRHLRSLPHLEYLSLEMSSVTDAGLPELKNCTILQGLRLNGTAITDAGLKQLQGMTVLRELHVLNTKVTRQGIQDLQRQLPDCKIVP